MRKIGLGQADWQILAKGIEAVDGSDVPVKGNDHAAGADVAGNRKCVSATSERSIHDRISGFDAKGLKRLAEKDRKVDCAWSRVHRAGKGWGWNVAADGHAMVLNPGEFVV